MKDRPVPSADPSATGQKILVVGAGIGGLSAAFRLQRAGYAVTVLESTAHVGGRMWTEEIDGYRIDTGAALLPDSYREMRRLIRDAGLTDDVEPSGDIYGFLRNGTVHRFGKNLPLRLLTTGLLSPGSKLRLLRLAADAHSLKDRISFRDLTLVPEADESCTGYADRRLNQELFDYLIEPLSTNYYFAPPEELSMTHVYLAATAALGTGYFNSPKGMSFLPRGLAEQLDVRHHSTVHSVEEESDGVVVRYTDHLGGECRESRAASSPSPALWSPASGPAYRPPCAPTCRGCATPRACTSPSASQNARRNPSTWIFVPRREYPGGLGLCIDHNRAPGRAPRGKGLITLYWPTHLSDALHDESDEVVTARALRDLEQLDLFPGLRRRIEMTRVSRCRPCVPLTHPGSIAELTQAVHSLDSTFASLWPVTTSPSAAPTPPSPPENGQPRDSPSP